MTEANKTPAAPAGPTAAPASRAGTGDDAPQVHTRPGAHIKVRAIQKGYYGDKRRRVGDVFVIEDQKAFSNKWMERVAADTPERLTSGNQELKRLHDEQLGAKGKGTGDQDVLK